MVQDASVREPRAKFYEVWTFEKIVVKKEKTNSECLRNILKKNRNFEKVNGF